MTWTAHVSPSERPIHGGGTGGDVGGCLWRSTSVRAARGGGVPAHAPVAGHPVTHQFQSWEELMGKDMHVTINIANMILSLYKQ